MLGLQYIGQVLRELLASDTNGGPAVRLHDELKASIAEFRGQIKSNRVGKEWSSLFVGNGIDASCLPYSSAPLLLKVEPSVGKRSTITSKFHSG
jgi:TorA maturation chaperone TorD